MCIARVKFIGRTSPRGYDRRRLGRPAPQQRPPRQVCSPPATAALGVDSPRGRMRLVPHRPQGASGRMRLMQPPSGFRAGVYTGMAGASHAGIGLRPAYSAGQVRRQAVCSQQGQVRRQLDPWPSIAVSAPPPATAGGERYRLRFGAAALQLEVPSAEQGRVDLQALLEAIVLAHDERLAQSADEPAPMLGHTAPVTGVEDGATRRFTQSAAAPACNSGRVRST